MERYGINRAGRCVRCGKLQVRFETDGNGRMVEIPDACLCPKVAPPKPKQRRDRSHVDNARRLAGVCQLCDRPATGRLKVALYCDEHRKQKRKEAQDKVRAKNGDEYARRYRERNREKLRRDARKYARQHREERIAYKRAWRKANREKVRMQKERAALRNFRDPAVYVRRWREEVAAGERRPKPARKNKHGERLCCNGLCRQVVTGRAKMCERCKRRLAREAAAVLEQRKAA